jgi:hypothetical protein
LHVLPQAVVGDPVAEQDRPAEQRSGVRASAVRDAQHEAERAGRVPRDQHGRDLDAGERDRLAIAHDDVAARRRQSRRRRRSRRAGRRPRWVLDEVPVGCRERDPRAALLEVRCAAEVIGVPVRDEHVAHVVRVETGSAHLRQ